MYEAWFTQVLAEALGAAGADGSEADAETLSSALPCGGNSFYRQLDFMVATVAAEAFRSLYAASGDGDSGGANGDESGGGSGSGGLSLKAYAARKDGLFARFRTIAEMLGVRSERALYVRECVPCACCSQPSPFHRCCC